MMDLLETFSALALISGLMNAMLPEGSLRRTAAMAAGLLMLLIWSDGLAALMQLPELSPPSSVLTVSGTGVERCAEAAAQAYQGAEP